MDRSHVNRYLKSDEFKGKVFKQSIRFYAMGFNDGRQTTILLSTLFVVKYDFDGKEVQYGPDDCALSKVHPPTSQGTLACLAAEFDNRLG